MVDWSSSMQQTFEYYTVDPGTWKDDKLLTYIKSSSITRDSEVETLGSAIFEISDLVGECYIRVYLIVIQNGKREKYPLGTFLAQTPSSNFDGKSRTVSMDAYTPLLELKEKQPPIGYYIPKNENIMNIVKRLTQENLRAPVSMVNCDSILNYDFVSDTNDTWLSFITDLMLDAKYTFDLDELGRILFAPKQEISSLQPIWTYDDNNSSILYPELSINHDIYGIPNVVEVVYSTDGHSYYAKVVNDDSNSPTSTVNRGREIIHRETEPNITGEPTATLMKEYAEQRLKDLSSIEYTVSYTHGYCPVKLGDCVRLNYSRAGLNGVKAKVISQTIKCEPGCPVTEKAVFTTNLWR